MIFVLLTFLGLGVKYSRLGKISLGGVKIYQMDISEIVECVGFIFVTSIRHVTSDPEKKSRNIG